MVTVGMNYEIVAGRESEFEEKFAAVLVAMEAGEGHVGSTLYREVSNPRSYLITSEWDTKAKFSAFIRSQAFKDVTSWGRDGILAGRPSHVVYARSESLD